MIRSAAPFVIAILGAACTPDPLLLAVDVRTDIVPGVEFDEVRAELLDDSGPAAPTTTTEARVDEDWLDGRRVAQLDDAEAGVFTLRVTLSLNGRDRIVQPVRVSHFASQVVTVSITRNCIGTVCPEPGDSPGATACQRGMCVSPDCVEDGTCLEPECTVDTVEADCVPMAACSTPVCVEGECLFESGGSCPAGGYCNPELGCVHPEWPEVAETLAAAAAQGVSGDPTFRTIPVVDLPAGSDRWVGGVLAPNGRIYGIPFDAGVVLEIDPEAGTTSTFGAVDGRYVGGVLASDGLIYAAPYDAAQVLVIDPVARTVEFFGPDVSSSANGWASPVVAANGSIYAMPATETRVMVIDPIARTVSFLDDRLPEGDNKYRGAVLSPSGLVVGIPAQTPRALIVDPTTSEVRTFGALSPMNRAWYGGVITPGGRVLGLPLGSPTLLSIDPLAEAVVETDTGATLIQDWGAAGALAPSGLVYRVPSTSPSVREIDPVTLTSRELGDLGAADGKWIGGVLAPNGRIYAIPWRADEVLEIDTRSVATLPMELLLSPWLNKL